MKKALAATEVTTSARQRNFSGNLLDNVNDEVEKAYRRGYAQAAYCAARDAAEGHDLTVWAKACRDWRFAPKFGPSKWAEIGACPPEAWETK